MRGRHFNSFYGGGQTKQDRAPKSTTTEEPFNLRFDQFPLRLREGPWSWVAFVALGGVAAVTGFCLHEARGGWPPDDGPAAALAPWRARTRLATAAYGVGLLLVMFRTVGAWPLASYTMVSWSLTTARALLLLGGCRRAAAYLRCASLTQNAITVLLWWGAIAPAIYVSLPTAAQRAAFARFNRTPFLVSVHLLNLPLAVVDHALEPRLLTVADFAASLTLGFAYLLFYLGVLDRRGVHFYIVLSPRTPLCGVVYGLILAIYYGIFRLVNRQTLAYFPELAPGLGR